MDRNERQDHNDHEEYNEYYNETSNTAAGINTPPDHQDTSAFDMVSGAIEEIMDNIEDAFDGNQTEES